MNNKININNSLGLSKINIKSDNFLVKTAETWQEVELALRLRFEVFNIEMNEGLESSYETGLDQDKFDRYCDHLLVIDLNTNRAVGTYRMLPKSNVSAEHGFYSEGEFDITNLMNFSEEILEMGRSCVHKDYRTNAVINLLWQGIAQYLKIIGAKYMFGCGSLHTKDLDEVNEIYSFLKHRYYSEEMLHVTPHPPNRVKGLRDDIEIIDPIKTMRKIPPILKGYFRLGAVICGEPAYDPEFGTTDFFILLSTEKITQRYLNHFTIE